MTKADLMPNMYSSVMARLKSKSAPNISLLGQDLGSIIFLYCAGRQISANNNDVDILLEKALHHVTPQIKCASWCNGISGLGVGLSWLERLGFVCSVEPLLREIDEKAAIMLTETLEQNTHDFLHGFIGLGLYFARRYNQNPELCTRQLVRIVNHLF